MKSFVVSGFVAVLVAGSAAGQEAPKPPAPTKEHLWLQQLAGEWETKAEMVMGPGQPAVKSKGTETTRVVGPFWVVGEHKGDVMGAPFTGLMTVGFDPAKGKYVGTWVCSMCDAMCHYEGTVDAAGKVLTLETTAPSPADPSKLVKMKDVLEVKDKDHRVMTSVMLGDDGKWVPFMTLTATRKK